MDVDTLSDSDLRLRCSNVGIKVGPLTATTRKLYLKKLKQAENSGAKPALPNGTSTPIKVPKARDKTPSRKSQINIVSIIECMTPKCYTCPKCYNFFFGFFFIFPNCCICYEIFFLEKMHQL